MSRRLVFSLGLCILGAFALQACPPAVPPTPDFSATPSTGFAPLNVQFNDLSTPGSAAITAWLWNFGDGSTGTVQNPAHTYTTAGSYTVVLTATSSAGSKSTTKSGFITVNEPVAPTANFSGAPREGDAPLNVQFTDTSTEGTRPITSRQWNFGDGGTSTQANPTHNYTEPGAYTVSLTVTTAIGSDTESKTNYIIVEEPDTGTQLTLSRTGANAGVFAAGGTYDITVTLALTGDGDVKALGLSELIPAGWSFDTLVSGAQPNAVNPSGESGGIEFLWFNIPAFPLTFTYRLNVPANSPDDVTVSGQAIFRTDGDELESNAVDTPLTRASG